MKKKIIRLKETTSTNDYIRACDLSDRYDLLVVSADYQTAGRGQGSNTWESEPGKNLLFSRVEDVPFTAQRWPEISLGLCLIFR